MRIHHFAPSLMVVFFSLAIHPCQAAGDKSNTTGLPTYPNSVHQDMDPVYRQAPNGQHCIHFSELTPDALDTVQDWYKKALSGAKIEDVNKNSLYGSYFKLDGIKLSMGNDFVNVYRMSTSKQTTIEIFKCRDAPSPPSE